MHAGLNAPTNTQVVQGIWKPIIAGQPQGCFIPPPLSSPMFPMVPPAFTLTSTIFLRLFLDVDADTVSLGLRLVEQDWPRAIPSSQQTSDGPRSLPSTGRPRQGQTDRRLARASNPGRTRVWGFLGYI
ncbi:hypothetical protein JB92DRAFT_2857322 [Gautieria morchelliformis]|nr:hypothetical protein JB92DRAFT_2857322 [Gautieria morchelliformis]